MARRNVYFSVSSAQQSISMNRSIMAELDTAAFFSSPKTLPSYYYVTLGESHNIFRSETTLFNTTHHHIRPAV